MSFAAANLGRGEWLLVGMLVLIFVASVAALTGIIYLAVRKARKKESGPPPVSKESR